MCGLQEELSNLSGMLPVTMSSACHMGAVSACTGQASWHLLQHMVLWTVSAGGGSSICLPFWLGRPALSAICWHACTNRPGMQAADRPSTYAHTGEG